MFLIVSEKLEIMLPYPELGNRQRNKSEVVIHRMNNDTITTYVKKRKNVHVYDFVLSRQKAVELLEFIRQTSTSLWILPDGVTGWYIQNPSEIAMLKRDLANFTMEIDENFTASI